MKTALTLVLALLLAPVSALAHHSFAAVFDASQPVELEGKITRVEWANPHIWFYLDVSGADGSMENWQCEGGTPNSLRRLGWSSDTLQEGDEVRIEGWRARDGTPTCNARTIVKGDRQLFAGSSFEEQ